VVVDVCATEERNSLATELAKKKKNIEEQKKGLSGELPKSAQEKGET